MIGRSGRHQPLGEEDSATAKSVPRKSAYIEPEIPENEESDEKPKEPYLREFDESDLEWLRAQMDAFLPDAFPFYKKDEN